LFFWSYNEKCELVCFRFNHSSLHFTPQHSPPQNNKGCIFNSSLSNSY
jgi:hypothetical protein